jgi:hypothetical protein
MQRLNTLIRPGIASACEGQSPYTSQVLSPYLGRRTAAGLLAKPTSRLCSSRVRIAHCDDLTSQAYLTIDQDPTGPAVRMDICLRAS